MRRVYFGHDELDIFTSLGIDEVLKERAKDSIFFRTYQINPAAVTIAEDEDISDINLEACMKENLNYTRRPSKGSAIYLDESVLCYTIIFPNYFVPSLETHEYFGTRIASALKEISGNDIWLGEKFSIAISPSIYGVISGNSWENLSRKGYGFYHGLITIKKHNVESIKRYIKLRVGEEEILKSLPYLNLANYSLENVSVKLAEKILGRDYEVINNEEKLEIVQRGKDLGKRFADEDWIKGRSLKIRSSGLGYCLIALSEEWKEENFKKI